MSIKNEQELLINEFLNDVNKKLPLWLKGNPGQRDDVLKELGDHMWDKAEELAGNETPSTLHIRESIAFMGSPKDIAREYRNRGTPKFFISEELWPWYSRGLIVIAAITVFVNLINMAFAISKNPPGQVVGQTFNGIWEGFLIGFLVISIIFIQLSYHGFLPRDFKKIKIAAEIQAEKEKKAKEKKKTKVKKTKPQKILEKPGNYLAEGIINLIFGFFMIFFPWENVGQNTEADLTAFFTWLALLGGVTIISGLIRFAQAIAGKQIRLQQTLFLLYLIPASLSIPLFLQMLSNSSIVIDPLLVPFPDANIILYVKIAVWFIIVATIIGMIDAISKIIRLEVQGLPEEKKQIKVFYKV